MKNLAVFLCVLSIASIGFADVNEAIATAKQSERFIGAVNSTLANMDDATATELSGTIIFKSEIPGVGTSEIYLVSLAVSPKIKDKNKESQSVIIAAKVARTGNQYLVQQVLSQRQVECLIQGLGCK
jgi:hypothetical protein